MSRASKLAKNTLFSLFLQVTTIISSFILPKLILSYYGSEVNGLVNSIGQFLQIIAFLELGVGAVVQSSLYKPLAERDYDRISKIVTSADKFFKRIGLILAVYVLILIGVYPFVVNQDFGFFYTAILIFSIGLSSFAQYYFGIVDQLLVTADQRGYIHYISSIITIILNTAVGSILIVLGASIQLVKLASSVIFLARPLVLRLYVQRKYRLNRKIKYSEEPIKQKWNGISQHIASVVLDHTDTVVLTLFSTLSSVSIYSVYHMVIYGVKTLFTSMTNGVQSLLGELYVSDDKKTLLKTFEWTEWVIHTSVVLLFGCTAVLVLPFVQLYTMNVKDADYYQPLFSGLIVLAHALHCLRLPYHIMIKAGGHYKETQWSYLIAAALNVIISIIMVNILGLVGVAIGTLIAMMYQTIWMAVYNSKNLLKRPLRFFIKQIMVDAISVIACIIPFGFFHFSIDNFYCWIAYAVIVFVTFLIIIHLVNLCFYNERVRELYKRIHGLIKSKVNFNR